MTLEDFEKELAVANNEKESRKRHREHRQSYIQDRRDRQRSGHSKERKEGHRSRHSHHSDRHHQHKRSRRDHSAEEQHRRSRDKRDKQNGHGSSHRADRNLRNGTSGEGDSDSNAAIAKEAFEPPIGESTLDEEVAHLEEQDLKRDTWMETPSSLDVEYVQRPGREESNSSKARQFLDANHERKIHEKELNHHLRDLHDEDVNGQREETREKAEKHEVSYTFGDSGSSWRMTRLKNVYREAKESGKPIEEVGFERFGSLREFDEMREEEIELDRRKMYGKNYVKKEKPSGELFDERVRKVEQREKAEADHETTSHAQGEIMEEVPPPTKTVVLDATALNKLKAQMMKAKLRGAPDAAKLEDEYNAAANAAATNLLEPEVIVLDASNHRTLGGSRNGEVRLADGKRARERGQLVENEDMSIEDMVRQERRSKHQPGGEGKLLAERIAKDTKFDNNLEYLDENAAKLAQRMHKSEINLRNTAICDLQKINRALDRCPLCYHEDTGTPPVAPVVSLATRTYLTLPTEPELGSGGALIVPIQHRKNLLECDDDEWEEIRNFMKCMIRMHDSRPKPQSVIFYENAAHPSRFPHAAMTAVALPPATAEMAPAFFKEAILTSDEEWTQHVKIIDTAARAREAGMGRAAFRKSLTKEMPYFHVWFNLDGGMGHVIEDANRWPRGDLFARETIGGMLDLGPEITRRQGRWHRQQQQRRQQQQQQVLVGSGDDNPRVQAFRKKLGWEKFDWTGVLEGGRG